MDRKAVIAAYNANVRSILEYCSIVWAGAAKSHLTRLERVQHKFLIWLANRTNAHSDSLNYDDLLEAFGLKSLHARRTENDIVFLCKIFKGFVSSTCLLRSFCLHVPMRKCDVDAFSCAARARQLCRQWPVCAVSSCRKQLSGSAAADRLPV